MSRVPDRVPPGPIKLTYEDYVDLPDDGRRYELEDAAYRLVVKHEGATRIRTALCPELEIDLDRVWA